MDKYSKKYDESMMKIKSSFLTDNEKLLEESNSIIRRYMKQPRRTKCKMCGVEFKGDELNFCSHEVKYIYCSNCNHLNGEYEETTEFCSATYVEDDYGRAYSEQEKSKYLERVTTIYKPKMDFLLESVERLYATNKIDILDVGAGSGYFVKAGIEAGVKIHGVEVSGNQAKFANDMIGEDVVKHIDINQTAQIISETNCNIVSMLGVLEHFEDFHLILESIQNNMNIKYFYFSVPMFSYSCVFETLFQEGYNRHMSGDHTHLFSNNSIEYMLKKYGFKKERAWHFGTDAMDLYRLMKVKLQQSSKTEGLAKVLDEKFLPVINDIQIIMDKTEFCSEIHMLVRK